MGFDHDGITPLLFHHLAKETRKLNTAHVFIPSTIIFDHGFAAQWYYSTSQMEIKRRNERDISAAEIWTDFTQHLAEREDIIAVFYSRVVKKRAASPTRTAAAPEDPDENNQTLTTFMSKAQLKTFLFSGGEKPTGVLQKFLYPKGWCSTSIVATWSPRVTMIEAVRNPLSLFDKTKSVAERGATHESPYATQVSVTNSVSTGVRLLCQQVVQHFHQTDRITMSGMMLHFKVDCDNRVVLLFSTSMRGKVEGSIFDDVVEPINLSHQMVNGETYLKRQKLQDFIEEKRRLARDVAVASGAPPSPTSVMVTSPKGVTTPTKMHAGATDASPDRAPVHGRPRSLSPIIDAKHHSTRTSDLYRCRAAEIGYVPPRGNKSSLVLPTVNGPAKFVGNRWVPLGNIKEKDLVQVSVDFNGEQDDNDTYSDSEDDGQPLSLDTRGAHRSPSHHRRRHHSRDLTPANCHLTPASMTHRRGSRGSSRSHSPLGSDDENNDNYRNQTPFDSSDEDNDEQNDDAKLAKVALDLAVEFFDDLFYSMEQLAVEQPTSIFQTAIEAVYPKHKIDDKYITLDEVKALVKEFTPEEKESDEGGTNNTDGGVVLRFPMSGKTFSKCLAQGRARSSIFLNKRRKKLRREAHTSDGE